MIIKSYVIKNLVHTGKIVEDRKKSSKVRSALIIFKALQKR